MISLTLFKDFFEFEFLTYALGATILISATSGLLSPILVGKRYAFLGEAVSHSCLFGLSCSLVFIAPEQNVLLFFSTLAITLISILFLAKASFRSKLPSDSLIGIFLTSTLSLGVLIHFLLVKNKIDLLSFLFGNILLVEKVDLLTLFLLTLILIPLIFCLRRSWIYFAYDEEGAYLSGIPIKFFHYLFFTILTLQIVSSVKIAGTLLGNTLLILPGTFAFKFSKSLPQVFIISILFSVTSSLLGLFLAHAFDLPSGATLAMTQFLVLILTLTTKKLRGLFI